MMRTLIVEDEPLARDVLRSFIARRPEIELIGEAKDGLEGIRLIDGLMPDLVLLDISLPECSGVDVLRRIQRNPAVVFTTAFDTYALTAFELGAFDYLLKPFQLERFNVAIDRVAERISFDENEPTLKERIDSSSENGYLERFFVRHLGHTVPVLAAEVLRFKADDDYTAIHLPGKRYLMHIPLQEIEQRLNPESFLRVHRSDIVNLNHIRSAVQADRRFTIEMSDGSRVTASRSRTQSIQALHLKRSGQIADSKASFTE
jgi:two-component system LytT family response regulator